MELLIILLINFLFLLLLNIINNKLGEKYSQKSFYLLRISFFLIFDN